MINRDIIFYNSYGIGDIHVSREFVNWICRELEGYYDYYYEHNHVNNMRGIIRSPWVKEIQIYDNGDFYAGATAEGKRMSTWYGHAPGFEGIRDCTLKTLHRLFQGHATSLGLQLPALDIWALPNIPPLLPSTDPWLWELAKYDAVVMLSNCEPRSQQSEADPSDISEALAEVLRQDEFKNVLVIATNDTPSLPSEWETAYNLLGTHNNIYECGQLSQHCDLIIGQSSGPYTFALNKNNLLDSYKTFLCFCKPKSLAYWAGDLARCKTVWSDLANKDSIKLQIEGTLRGVIEGKKVKLQRDRKKEDVR